MAQFPIPTEHEEQAALIEWWHLASRKHEIPEHLLFAIPNGGMRQKATAALLKSEGVRAGAPDLMLAVPRGGYHGLFIELKRIRNGRVTPDQREFLTDLQKREYCVRVAKGFNDAKTIIEDYITRRISD